MTSHSAAAGSPPGRGSGGRIIATVTAASPVRAPTHAVYGFLERLTNHERISGRWLRIMDLAGDGRGARIAIHGPLGVRRTARTAVTILTPPSEFGGTAAVGRHTVADVRWIIDHADDGSHVTLTATVLRAGVVDRMLLAIGGRWWLARCFDHAVAMVVAALATD